MQRTEKYFEQDAFRTECESVILAAEPDEKTGGGRIALDGTVFYPEGGGQPADRGTLTLPDGTVLRARGECEGEIMHGPKGDGGFGYDPVFFVPPLKKTFAQLTAEEKNAISHRGSALRAFAAELKTYLEKQ